MLEGNAGIVAFVPKSVLLTTLGYSMTYVALGVRIHASYQKQHFIYTLLFLFFWTEWVYYIKKMRLTVTKYINRLTACGEKKKWKEQNTPAQWQIHFRQHKEMWSQPEDYLVPPPPPPFAHPRNVHLLSPRLEWSMSGSWGANAIRAWARLVSVSGHIPLPAADRRHQT